MQLLKIPIDKTIKMSSFTSSENTQKTECRPDRPVSNNKFSSVTLNELAMKARHAYCNFEFQSIMQSILRMIYIQMGSK